MTSSETTPTTQRNKRRQPKTSVACQACKSRKSKCSGGPPPCEQCQRLQTKCAISPDTDMRRRESKGDFKAFKALLDAFVTSTRQGDVALSSSLYQTIQRVDPSGRLAEIAQSYAQGVSNTSPCSSEDPTPEFVFKWGKVQLGFAYGAPTPGVSSAGLVSESPSSYSKPSPPSSDSFINKARGDTTTMNSPTHDEKGIILATDISYQDDQNLGAFFSTKSDESSVLQAVEDRPIASFEELYDFWIQLRQNDFSRHLTASVLPGFGCDPYIHKPDDPMSQSLLDFRDGARRAIMAGADTSIIIGKRTPIINDFFQTSSAGTSLCAWAWACQFARAFPHYSLPLQLATIYLTGIQMRFFIAPCAETWNDLPPMLRPLRRQYTDPHAAGVDICHFPVLKNYFFDHWDQYDQLMISGQSCNWPYSDSACLAYTSTGEMTMSRAFLDHLSVLSNYTVGRSVLESVPQMAQHVKG